MEGQTMRWDLIILYISIGALVVGLMLRKGTRNPRIQSDEYNEPNNWGDQ